MRALKNEVRRKYVEEVTEILAQPTTAQIVDTATDGVTKNIKKAYTTGRNGFTKVVGDRPKLRGAEVKATLLGQRKGRAFYKSKAHGGQESTVNFSKGEGADTVAHELAHWLEEVDQDYYKGVKAFYARRTKGNPIQRLRDITGRPYKLREVTRADEFTDPYTGKVYEWRGDQYATEITPMFFTNCFTDIHAFIKADPDYFNSIYKLLNTY